jgi:hypothetical protein
VNGELARDEWTDKATGEPRHRYYINARSLEFLDFRLDRAATGHDTPSTQAGGDEAAVDAF